MLNICYYITLLVTDRRNALFFDKLYQTNNIK